MDEKGKEPWPMYCCVILVTGTTDPERKLFMELRNNKAKVASGELTCFGGKREKGEEPEDCVIRECVEEMCWSPSKSALTRECDLYVDDRLVAWFYVANGPTQSELTFENGRTGLWANYDDKRITGWHQTVLRAWLNGQHKANHVTQDAVERTKVHAFLDALPINQS
eukprot:m.264978 g.264978  ORF g.264978 m.264978 type:complete len:167 (-) comp59181_c0_seq1:153-653(-)